MQIKKDEIERRLARFRDAAKAAGVKLTHQRLEILREVASSLEHPDAVAVFRAVQPRMPTVSLDTVYRTLALASELGVISTLGARRESVRFDGNRDPHHHFVCIHCGLIRDFESAALDTLRVPSSAKRFGEVITTYVEVRGVCPRCAGSHTKTAAAKGDGRPRRKARNKP